ncbi:MAG: insulinase family protein, partial [Myxococcales bacterium]|nr:insulinase family protein [Myxococcales bacterium]
AAVADPAPPAPAAPVKAEKIRELNGITEYRLPNGLQVLLYPDASLSTVTVNMTYFVGSRVEGYGETGMAHLLEHMTFKGTAKYGELLAELRKRGARVNGSTWNDRTNYFETLPASSDNLAFALDVEAERMRNCTMKAEDLASEFSVVRSEFEMGENNPRAILDERVTASAYLWHNYGKSTIGSRSDIERVPIENLKAFYDKYYQPDDAMLVIAGEFDPAETLALVEQIYGPIPRPTRQLGESYTVEPVQDGERAVTLRRAGDVQIMLAAYHTVAGSDPDHAAVEAAADILTREPSGRLYGPLVKSKLASSLYGYSYQFKDPGLATFGVEVRDPKNAAKVKQLLLDAIEGLGKSTITDAEVERWRNDTLKNLELHLADTADVAVELSEWAAMGDWRLLFAYRDQVKKVTAADVKRVAATWFKSSNRTFGEFIPTKDADRAPLPPQPDVAAIAGAVKGESVETGEDFVASLDNLEARTTFTKLAGGLDAALLPKKTRGGAVTLVMSLRHGDVKSLARRSELGGATAALVQRGTTKHTYQQLEDEKDKLKARIDIWGSEGAITIRIETIRDSLLPALALASEMLTSPSFPADELEVVRQQTLAQLEEQREDPYARGFGELSRTISPYPVDDPRHDFTIDEQIARWKKLKLSEIKAYHKDFWGAGKGELAVIGDFDPDALKTAIEADLGGWKTKHPWTRMVGKRFAVKGAVKQIDLKDKEMALLAIGQDLDLRQDDPDYPAAMMVGQVLGGSPSSRLWLRMREKEGWSYGTQAWLSASPFDRVGQLGMMAILAPQNLAKGEAAMLEELRKLHDDGVGADELETIRNGYLEQRMTSLADDRSLGFTLLDLLYQGKTLAKIRADLDAVRKLDAAAVSKAARTYLDPSRLVVIEAADYAKGKANAEAEAAAAKAGGK